MKLIHIHKQVGLILMIRFIMIVSIYGYMDIWMCGGQQTQQQQQQ